MCISQFAIASRRFYSIDARRRDACRLSSPPADPRRIIPRVRCASSSRLRPAARPSSPRGCSPTRCKARWAKPLSSRTNRARTAPSRRNTWRNPIPTATHCSSPPSARSPSTPALRSDLPYDPLKDFAAVGEAAVNSTMLVVNANMPVNSARELADLARKKPGAITIGVTGRGAISDLGRRLVRGGGRHQAAGGAVSRRSAGDHRHSCRPPRRPVRRRADGDGAGASRQTQSARRHLDASAPIFSPTFRPSSSKALPAWSATTGRACWRRPARRSR